MSIAALFLLLIQTAPFAQADGVPALGEDPTLVTRVFAPANLRLKAPIFPSSVRACQPSDDGSALLAFDEAETRAAWVDLRAQTTTQLQAPPKSAFKADFTPDAAAGVTHIVVMDSNGQIVHRTDEPGVAYLPQPQYGQTTDGYRAGQIAASGDGTRVAYRHWLGGREENPFLYYDFSAGSRTEIDALSTTLTIGSGGPPVFSRSGNLLMDITRIYDLRNRARYDLAESLDFYATSADDQTLLGYDSDSSWHLVTLTPELSDKTVQFPNLYLDLGKPDPIQLPWFLSAKTTEIHADGEGSWGHDPGTPVSIAGRDDKSYNWTFQTQIPGQTVVRGLLATSSSPLAFVSTAGGAPGSRSFAVQIIDVDKLTIGHAIGASCVGGSDRSGLLAIGKSDGSVEVYSHAF